MQATRLLALGIVVLAFLLRIFHLGFQQLWLDEALSFHIASLETGLGRVLGLESSPPLYYLLLRLWLPVAGTSEAAVRLPSAVAGTLGVLAIMWTGRQIFSSSVGLWAGAFCAVAPIHVYYSQEARTYTLLTLALALTYGLLWRAMQRNTRTGWGLTAASALAALYSHYLAIFGLAPTLLVLWAWPYDAATGLRRRRFVMTCLLTTGLYAPWLIWAFLLTSRADIVDVSTFWAELWRATPPAMAIPRSLELAALGPQRDLMMIHMKQFVTVRLPDPLRWLGLVMLMGLGLLVAVPWRDAALKVPWLGRRKAWAASLLVVPLAGLWLVSLSHPIYVPGRYDQVAFVGFALMVGIAFAKLQAVPTYGSILVAVAALGLFAPMATKLTLYYAAPADREAETTAQAVHLLVQNGDVAVFDALRGIPILHYYLPRLGYDWQNATCRNREQHREFTCRMFPLEMEKTFIPSARRTPEQTRAAVATFLSAASATRGQLWVLLFDGGIVNGVLGSSRPEDLALVEELVRVGYQPDTVNFGNVPAMYLFQRYTPGIAQPRGG